MYKLTERAADDFAGIYDYTLLKFGEAQADHYTDALEAFGTLYLKQSIEFQRHAIFYTVRDTDILIARILHQQMNHKRHLL